LSFEQYQYVRMALEKFVQSQMQPGDLVVILRGSGATGAQQLFSSDKRLLLSRIKNLRWGGAKMDCGSGG